MAISKKKEDELYSLIHKDLMDARIQVKMKLKTGLVNSILQDEIDDILSDLTTQLPFKAIKFFNPNVK